MIPTRQIPLWVAAVVLFAVAIIVSTSLVFLNRAVDQSHQAELSLSTVKTLSYKIDAIEWEIASEREAKEALMQELSQAKAEITKSLDEALAADPQNSDLVSTRASLSEYLKWLDEEIQFINSGRMEEAKQMDVERVDPAFDRMAESLAASQAGFVQRAKTIRTATNIGSIFLIMVAALLIMTLWSNNQKAWIKTLQVTTEQKTLAQAAKHSEELAAYAEALNRRNAQLLASARVTRQTAEIQDTEKLMNAVVNLTAEQFGYTHVGLYILDEQKRIAFLQAASSQTGIELIEQGFSVEINNRHIFNSVVKNGEPYSINNVTETTMLVNDKFPETQSRIVLPLTVRGSVIGLLDLHSEHTQVFGREDVEILLSLSNLMAISLDSVRLLDETRALVNQLETYTSQQSKEAWQKFTSRRTPAYQYTPTGVRPIFQPSRRDGGEGLRIPLTLRGHSIGLISLHRKNNSTEWNERERLLVEKIAAQAALALDNSRLVDEAQRNAQRNHLITNVSNRVRETLDMGTVAKIAAVELQRIFDLKEAEVSVGSLTPEDVPGIVTPKKSPDPAKSN